MTNKKTTLPSGLRIITVPIPQSESVTALILVAAGSRYEVARINGLSHFLEHMAFKGTKKRPNAQVIASEIEGLGAEFNAYTSKDHTGYYIKAAKHHLPAMLDVLSDMLLSSTYDEKEIEKEKGVIIEEIRMYEDMPMRKIGDIYESLLYGDTPLGWDIAGTEDVIRSIKRQDFVDYVGNQYSPLNTVVVVAGAVGDAEKIITEKFGGWTGKKTPDYVKHADVQEKPGLLVHHKKTEQAHLAIGVRSFKLGDPRRYVMSMMTSILGGGMSSRLFTEVREKRGLAYYVRSGGEYYQDVGNFVTQAGLDVSRIEDAVKVIIEETMKMTKELVTEEEISRAKEYVKGHYILDLEDSRNVASIFANSELLEGHVRTPEETLKGIDVVTREEIQALAKSIFDLKKLNLAIIGPFEDKAKFGKLLGI